MNSEHDVIRKSLHTFQLHTLVAGLLAAGMVGAWPSIATAQTPAPTPATPAAATPAETAPAATTTPSADDIKQRAQELEAARQRQKDAAELQEKLKAEIAAIGQDRSKL